jgi:hypothetical protein
MPPDFFKEKKGPNDELDSVFNSPISRPVAPLFVDRSFLQSSRPLARPLDLGCLKSAETVAEF